MLQRMDTTWDIESIRSQYPALKNGAAYLDGAGGTQVPEGVIDAISEAYRSGLSNVHGPFASSRRSMKLIADARAAVADLVGGEAGGVVLGPNMTTLTYRMAGALATTRSSCRSSTTTPTSGHGCRLRPPPEQRCDGRESIRTPLICQLDSMPSW
jgi:selenocysteine lyase/cysteine desulfurase